MHQPDHSGDLVHTVDDIPGMPANSDVRGPVVDEKTHLLGGDTGHDGLGDGGNSGPGLGGTTTDPNYGVIDPGPDSDQPVQTSGPQEPGHETFKFNAPGAAADAPQGNSTEASATADKPVESPALAAAHDLKGAIIAELSERDPWGTRERYADAMAAPAGRAESAGEKAADKLVDAVGGHADTPSQHHPIDPHESSHIPELHDAGGVLADLIHAAENPMQSGFGAGAAQLPGGDALDHIGANLADHGDDAHAGDDVQAVSLHVAPLHETPVEHHAAPVLEVSHFH
jgi:hypothetical protein